MRALDHRGEKRLPVGEVVTALKRMGIELLLKEREVERALRVFEVRLQNSAINRFRGDSSSPDDDI